MARRCAIPDCTTILSIYNPEPRCWVHTPHRPVIGSGLHIASEARVHRELLTLDEEPKPNQVERLLKPETDAYWKGEW